MGALRRQKSRISGMSSFPPTRREPPQRPEREFFSGDNVAVTFQGRPPETIGREHPAHSDYFLPETISAQPLSGVVNTHHKRLEASFGSQFSGKLLGGLLARFTPDANAIVVPVGRVEINKRHRVARGHLRT